MVTAYLRNPDLIKPSYSQGQRSRFRETMILNAMELESVADRKSIQFDLLTRSAAAITDSNARAEIMHQAIEAGNNYITAKSLNIKELIRTAPESRAKKIGGVYKVLAKQGLVGVKAKDVSSDVVFETIKALKELEKQKTKVQ